MESSCAARDARALEIDQRERKTALARLVGGAREHDGVVGIHAVDHRDLGARKLAALEAGADGFRRHRAHAFGAREGSDQLAFRDLGQELRLLVFAAGREQRFREQIHRRGERHGRQHPAQFLGHDAKLQIAEAEPAVILGDGGAQPAHFGHALPQRAVMAVLAFEHAADHLVGAFLGEELAGLVAEHLLIVGKVEIHGFRPVWSGWLPATIETLPGCATPRVSSPVHVRLRQGFAGWGANPAKPWRSGIGGSTRSSRGWRRPPPLRRRSASSRKRGRKPHPLRVWKIANAFLTAT